MTPTTQTPTETNRSASLEQGTVHYRETGPADGPVLVFVHGLLVNHTLWDGVVARLDDTHRCIAPDLPLGSHSEAMERDADLTPGGIAKLIADFLEALDLQDVTLVANDTGGALSQIAITTRPERIGRVVLTNCDAYEHFLPLAFRPLQWLAKIPGALTLATQPLRIKAVRPSPLGFGLLTKGRVPDAVLESWSRPVLTDRAVRRDAIKLLKTIHPRYTLEAAEKLGAFPGPALLAWAPEDRFFKIAWAEKLCDEFADGRLERIEGARTFVMQDQPERLAELVGEFADAGAGAVGKRRQTSVSG
jgi:pimeloyl-ACP methyl ester carboxylesterase